MNIGAEYYKCDFQIHTPRDIQFTGRSYLTNDERKGYSENFIKACREKGIDAVAITDHHDLYFYNYIKEASLNEVDSIGNTLHEQKRIVVFPGIELTLDVPCQALLIFDSNLEVTDEIVIKIYTALKISGHLNRESSKTGQTARLPFKSINDVYDSLNDVPELKGKFIIFPNVKDGGGDSIFRENFYNEYAKGVFVGGYLDRGLYEAHKTKVGWNNIIEGKTSGYGNRSIGIFQTSDNRTDTFEHLGTCGTWVKWSSPTAEGLRQACLAKRSRILQIEPILPLTRIESLKISNSSFLKDLDVDFNPQFNVCIGGRGTGKSSLLQYISWALGKDSSLDKKAELEPFIKNTLVDGYVEILVLKRGIPHLINRSLTSYKMKIGDDDWQSVSSNDIFSIIQTDSFAQKELSKHEKDKTKQLIQIIENAVSSEVESVKRQIQENGFKIKEVATSYDSYLSNVDLFDSLKTQIDSVEEQIRSLNRQLDTIPSADQAIIKNNNLVVNEKTLVKNSDNQIDSLKKQIESIIETGNFTNLTLEVDNVKNTTQIQEFVENHNLVVNNLLASLQQAVSNLNFINQKNIKEAVFEVHRIHDADYDLAKERQSDYEKIFKELDELRKKQNVLVSDRDRVAESLGQEKGTRKLLQKLFYQRNLLNIRLFDIINSAVEDISSKSEGTLEIKLTDLENLSKIIENFISTVTGSKGQSARTIAFFKTFSAGKNTYKNLLKFWFSLYRSQRENTKVEDILKLYGLKNDTLLDTDFERINESLPIALIVDFALQLPSYDLELKYCKDKTTKIPFEEASYGQQAGSILTILLNQEFGPLIIDQPEDDLDNKIIHQITENIVSAKHKRQLIFTSHNANIAVNGDAELILVFDHNSDKSAGEIVEMGSIDLQSIKHRVKDVMEGGEKAFDMRKNKYGF